MKARLMAGALMALAAVAHAGPVPGQGTWEATLQPLDLDGDSVTDAFFDTDLKITWLRNANVNGLMTLAQAVKWADEFEFGGFSDWRLPITNTCGGGHYCFNNEMGHLWHYALGNAPGGPMTNTGDFQNLEADYYWASLIDPEHNYPAGYFVWNNAWGANAYNAPYDGWSYFALLVRGTTIIPEPATYALMLSGLGMLVAVARRRAT